MDIFSGLLNGFSVALTPMNLLFCFLGAVLGTAIGVLPGLGPAATIALLLPIASTIASPVTAIILMAGIFYGSMYGGSTTSILLNLPGEAASVVTCIDGYQMARKGRAGVALGIAAIGSFIAGTVGVFVAMLAAVVAIRRRGLECVVELARADRARLRERRVARDVLARRLQDRLSAAQLALRVLERRLVRARVDVEEDLVLLDCGALRVVAREQDPGDLGADLGVDRAFRRALPLAADRHVLLDDLGDDDLDGRRRGRGFLSAGGERGEARHGGR